MMQVDRTDNPTPGVKAIFHSKTAHDTQIIYKPVAVTSEEYQVQAIVGHKTYKGNTYYRVKWQGYPEDENTWEPTANLHKAHKLLNNYRSSLHTQGRVESIIDHRRFLKPMQDGKMCTELEYLVKWHGADTEYSSWEDEETVRGREGKQVLIYYRIRNNVGFGKGPWSKAKEAKATELLEREGLAPETGAATHMVDQDITEG